MARHDNVIGRYVYLTINGIEYRVYYESSGTGIPLVCQHTAGAHGFQWRHLMENTEITREYQVIAWDLPFHGKSMPPVEDAHWTKPYNLTRDFFLKFITTFCRELSLERPVFMGCSMGGQVAVDLAAEHGDQFRAVIGVESSLASPGYYLDQWYHPRISNEAKPATMYALCAPTSPEKYIRETVFGYSQGAPMVFKGLLAKLLAVFPRGVIVIVNVKGLTAEGNRVAVEAESYGVDEADKIYNNFYHFLFEFRDHQIIAVREYMDTLHVNATFFA